MTIFELQRVHRAILASKFIVYFLFALPLIALIILFSFINIGEYGSFISIISIVIAVIFISIGVKTSEALDRVIYNTLMKSLLKDINIISETGKVLKEYYPLVDNYHIYDDNKSKVIRIELNPPNLVWVKPENYIEYICNESGVWKITSSFEEPDEDDDDQYA